MADESWAGLAIGIVLIGLGKDLPIVAPVAGALGGRIPAVWVVAAVVAVGAALALAIPGRVAPGVRDTAGAATTRARLSDAETSTDPALASDD